MGEQDWKQNLVEDDGGVREIIRGAKRVAVLGIKPETHAGQPAHYVPKYLAGAGVEVVPVPVYFPEVTEILGKKVHRTLGEVPGPLDIVDVFRKPSDIDGHVDDLIEKRPKVVWFQSGITNDAAAQRLAKAGIKVVQDRCLMVDHRRFA